LTLKELYGYRSDWDIWSWFMKTVKSPAMLKS
jgi:hypothetical protein